MGVKLLPATRTHRDHLEKSACRLACGVKPYTFASVRGHLLAEALGNGATRKEANAWVDEAMAFIRRRINQYRAIQIGDPEAQFDLGYCEVAQ